MAEDTLSVMLELVPTRAGTWPPGVDREFEPVPMAGAVRGTGGLAMTSPETLVVRADVARTAVARLRASRNIVGVWSDPQVLPVPAAIDCSPQKPTGTSADIARALGADRVWAEANYRGAGAVIGIVDGGIDGSRFPVTGGWSPDPRSPPGDAQVAWEGHGNMSAFDASIACPEAAFHDYSIGKTAPGAGIGGLLSSALQSFQRALTQFRSSGAPQVLSNSWGLYQEAWDPFPHGDPGNYTRNPAHVFTRKLVELLDAGMLVGFAAGNCGGVCADPRCARDHGPGRGIWGANGHERAICVGAVNLRREWIGYSSEGPAALSPEKPDVCGYSHFAGWFPSDTGTSAACPVVAGVLALLAGSRRGITQDRARAALRANTGRTGWDPRFGAGAVDAHATWAALAP
jgi:subtilisin family serine protease